MTTDPIRLFQEWYAQAQACCDSEVPDAMVLSTIHNGEPDSRVVLLKQVDQTGFAFMTNYESSKGQDLLTNPRACLLFFWGKLERQVRIRGSVKKTSVAFSEAYFKTRSRDSQIGAWASNQSSVITDRSVLETAVTAVEARFHNKPISCPPYWGGYWLVPHEIEFWVSQPARLHDRFLYTKKGSQWVMTRLSP